MLVALCSCVTGAADAGRLVFAPPFPLSLNTHPPEEKKGSGFSAEELLSLCVLVVVLVRTCPPVLRDSSRETFYIY